LNSCLLGRTPWVDCLHQETVDQWYVEDCPDLLVDKLAANTEPGADDTPVLNQLRYNLLGDIDGYGEANVLDPDQGRRVYPDNLSAPVQKWPT